MRAIVAGAGRLGAQIAQVLSASGNDVTLVDLDDDRADTLRGRLAADVVAGDACEPAVLEHAGALNADFVIATTGQDESNLVIGLLAKRQFAVPRVAARVNDAENDWLFDLHWGVDIAVPAAMPLVSLIEEATGATDTVALLRLGRAGVGLTETAITESSRGAGRALGDIVLPVGTVIATVIRDGQPTTPTGDLRLRPGDELLIVSHAATEREIHEVFQ